MTMSFVFDELKKKERENNDVKYWTKFYPGADDFVYRIENKTVNL